MGLFTTPLNINQGTKIVFYPSKNEHISFCTSISSKQSFVCHQGAENTF